MQPCNLTCVLGAVRTYWACCPRQDRVAGCAGESLLPNVESGSAADGCGSASSPLSGAVTGPVVYASPRWRSRAPARTGGQLHDNACRRQVSKWTGRSPRRPLAGSNRQPPPLIRPIRKAADSLELPVDLFTLTNAQSPAEAHSTPPANRATVANVDRALQGIARCGWARSGGPSRARPRTPTGPWAS